jgi:hypothetical protein
MVEGPWGRLSFHRSCRHGGGEVFTNMSNSPRTHLLVYCTNLYAGTVRCALCASVETDCVDCASVETDCVDCAKKARYAFALPPWCPSNHGKQLHDSFATAVPVSCKSEVGLMGCSSWQPQFPCNGQASISLPNTAVTYCNGVNNHKSCCKNTAPAAQGL